MAGIEVNSFDSFKKEFNKLNKGNLFSTASLIGGHRHIPTGIFSLDYALLGGILEGQVTMFYGYAASGKTTVCAKLLANAQKKYPDKKVVFIDLEGSFDPTWFEHHGVDLSMLETFNPDIGEQAVDAIETLAQLPDVSMIVLDSVAAVVPTKEIDKSAEDAVVGARAALLSRMCSKLTAAISSARKKDHYPAIVFTNQFREKIGVMFGDSRTLPGGKWVNEHIPSLKVEFKKAKENLEKIGGEDNAITHNKHVFSIEKSRIGSGIKSGEYTLIRSGDFYKEFIDKDCILNTGAILDHDQVLDRAKDLGLYSGGGSSWKLWNIEDTFANKAATMKFLQQPENEEYYLKLKQALILALRDKLKVTPPMDNYILTEIK